MKNLNKAEVVTRSIKLGVCTARKSTSTYHLANSLLNILNSSPKLFDRYSSLFSRNSLFFSGFFNIISILGLALLSFWNWRNHIKTKPGKSSCDILFVSHLTTVKHLETEDDFYFGNLEKICLENGLKTKTLLINHCKANNKGNTGKRKRNAEMLSAYLSPIKEISLAIKLIGQAFSLPKIGVRDFDFPAKWAQFDRYSIANARIHDQVLASISESNPKILVYTFEGHGWERMICKTAHNHKKNIKVIAYHHAVLFPGPRAMNFKFGKGADPDIILMSGTSTASTFCKQSEYSKEVISVLGSLKHVPVTKKASSKEIKKACLIIPEGDISEVRIMVRSALGVAISLPEVHFILRLHPMLTSIMVRKSIPELNRFPENFSFSNANLDTDISRASWMLYRASSVVLTGMAKGIRPIYINSDDSNLINDPIPNTISYKKVASTDKDIINVIKKDLRVNNNVDSIERQLAVRFAENYYTPYDPMVFVNIAKKFLFSR